MEAAARPNWRRSIRLEPNPIYILRSQPKAYANESTNEIKDMEIELESESVKNDEIIMLLPLTVTIEYEYI